MIWDYLKAFFWCGVFHKTEVYGDDSPFADGTFYICKHCGTKYWKDE